MTAPNTSPIVTQRTLDLYDKYDGDFGLLDERGVSKEDKKAVTEDEAKTLGEYVSHLHYLNSDILSEELRNRFMNTIKSLEPLIEDQVIKTLKERITQLYLNKK